MTIPTVTDDLLAEIESAAKAATPGARRTEDDDDSCAGAVFVCAGLEMYTGGEICRAYSYDDADLIALMSPEVVLALIARLREIEEAQRWIPVEERLPEPGLLVQVYSPPQPGDWPHTVRIETDGIDPESEDYWVGHGEHYERYCMIAKGGDVEWTGPAEKAPYTHWKPLPEPPCAT